MTAPSQGHMLEPEAQMLLGHIGGHDLPRPGEFYSKLLDAMLAADQGNLMRLSFAFPSLGAVVVLYKWTVDGYLTVCGAAGVEPQPSDVPQA